MHAGKLPAKGYGMTAPAHHLPSRVVLVLLIGACSAHAAVARETHAGFNVRVRVLNSGRAASVRKAVVSATSPPATSRLNQLSFAVTTRAGYFVRFEVVDPAVELVEIHGLGPEMRMASGTRDVFVPPGQEGRVVSYSVTVRPGAELSAAPPVRATILP